jgi:hypothetical protein
MAPHCCLEIAAPLIDRQRLKRMPYMGAERSLIKCEGFGAKSRAGNAERTDRIPDADAFDLHIPVAVGRKRVEFSNIPSFFSQRIPVPDLDEAHHLRFLQHADGADHAAEAARDKRAAGKAEHKDLVAVDIVVGDEAVAGFDAQRDADAGAAAGDAIEKISGADTRVIVDDLGDSAVGRRDGAHQAHDIGLALAVGPVPGSVTADNEPPPSRLALRQGPHPRRRNRRKKTLWRPRIGLHY